MRKYVAPAVSRSGLDYEKYLYVEPNGRLHFKVEQPGPGYFHPLTKDDVRQRLASLPQAFLANLHTVYMPRMTRKRKTLNIYGLQYGYVIYLYPMPDSMTEDLGQEIKPLHRIEAVKAGAVVTDGNGSCKLQWTKDSLRTFYRDNILIHELGHTIDEKNTKEIDRERFAEEFVIKWGRRK